MSDVGTQAEWVDVANSYNPQTPDSCVATFYQKENFLPAKSKIEGRAVYENEEFIRIITPGDSKSIVERPTLPGDKERFPQQYARFRASEEQIPDGIPLKTVAWLNPAQRAELAHIHIVTVEQLAELSDGHLDKVMGLHDLRKRAQAFIQPADDTYKQQQAEIAELKAQLADISARLQQDDGDTRVDGATLQAPFNQTLDSEAHEVEVTAQPPARTRRRRAVQ